MKVCLRAYAKLNLWLRVGPRRPDGYHEIATLLQAISLHDTVELWPRRGGFTFEVDGPEARGVPRGKSNLVLGAARLLASELGETRGARIRLTKRVPWGAGLGGGSSDAAATLRGLLRLWQSRLPSQRLHELAAHLGSDVPFFLGPGTAFATGRGDRLEPLSPPSSPLRFLIVVPKIRVSTRWAYQKYRNTNPIRKSQLTRLEAVSTLVPLRKKPAPQPKAKLRLVNDLEDVVLRAHPLIADTRQQLLDWGALVALMSGSGSAVFGLFPPDIDPKAVATRLSCIPVSVFLARSVRAGMRPCR